MPEAPKKAHAEKDVILMTASDGPPESSRHVSVQLFFGLLLDHYPPQKPPRVSRSVHTWAFPLEKKTCRLNSVNTLLSADWSLIWPRPAVSILASL
jgi:hypothetical protein